MPQAEAEALRRQREGSEVGGGSPWSHFRLLARREPDPFACVQAERGAVPGRRKESQRPPSVEGPQTTRPA